MTRRCCASSRRAEGRPRAHADAESPLGCPFPRALARRVAPSCSAARAFTARRCSHRGLLVYETFTERQRELGYGPVNPAFLLESGELPRLFPELAVVESVEGRVGTGTSRAWLAGLVARKAG
jgi:hypothetical protein